MFTFRTALIINSKPENTTRNKKLVLFHPAGQRLVAGMASVQAAFALTPLTPDVTSLLMTVEAESAGERKPLLSRNELMHSEPSRQKYCCQSKALEVETQ